MTAVQDLRAMGQRFGALAKAAPETMGAFRSLMGAATNSGIFPARHKELVAVALAVHKGCGDCIVFHVSEALKHGASRAELIEILSVAIEMGGGPATVYASRALEAFDALATQPA